MSLEARLDSLTHRHADADRRLHDEESKTTPDDRLVKSLKVEKLKAKDEIERIRKNLG